MSISLSIDDPFDQYLHYLFYGEGAMTFQVKPNHQTIDMIKIDVYKTCCTPLTVFVSFYFNNDSLDVTR